jgi:mannosyl-oligosaccharide glucosidase
MKRKPPHTYAPSAGAMSLWTMGAGAAALLALLAVLYQQLLRPGSVAVERAVTPSSLAESPASAAPRAASAAVTLLGHSSALQHFTTEHNASLRWGTYRPGVYFGLRSLTAPTALTAGLMWAADGLPLRHQCEQDGLERYGFMAHDGRGYGAQPIVDEAHGVELHTSFVATSTSGWAVRLEATVASGRASKATPPSRPLSLYFYAAVDAELAPAGAADGGGSLERRPPSFFQPEGAARLHGTIDDVGTFTLFAEATLGASPTADGTSSKRTAVPVHAWASPQRSSQSSSPQSSQNPGASHLNVADLVAQQLEARRQAAAAAAAAASRKTAANRDGGGGGANVKELSDAVGTGLDDAADGRSRLVVFHVRAAPPFTMELLLVPAACAEGKEGAAEGDACAASHAAYSGSALTSRLAAKQAAFDERLLTQLGLGSDPNKATDGAASKAAGIEAEAVAAPTLRGAPLGARELRFAAHALSALLGSIGFFYGSSTIAPPTPLRGPHTLAPARTPPAALLTVVPSRPFFPRGFLWDEGFHQLVVGAWDAPLADHILASWLGLMHADGWIPREQILGAEAEARVPPQFLAQHRQHANPPALLLRLHSLLSSLEADDEPPPPQQHSQHPQQQHSQHPQQPRRGRRLGHTQSRREQAARTLAVLSELWPRLVKWHAWFLRTQAGEVDGSFRWRGRDANDRRLNAMTLSSGLDDYPRASTVSNIERHVDLHSWVAFFTRLLARLGARLGKSDEAGAYEAQFEAQLEALSALHWDRSRKAYLDWGEHANDGDFRPFFVVKCATRDGQEQVRTREPP